VAGTLAPKHRELSSAQAQNRLASVDVHPRTVAELRSALNAIPSDDYELWIRVGHALAKLGNVGRELWLSWSQQSEKWRPEDARKWGTFRGDNTGYQAVFAEAARRGWVNPASRDAQYLGAGQKGQAL
jgi:hypothetical protein